MAGFLCQYFTYTCQFRYRGRAFMVHLYDSWAVYAYSDNLAMA